MKEHTGELDFIPFRYQGQHHDPETGLYYNRFRYYSPAEGIYTQPDPIGLAGKNPTLYVYADNPNLWIDPFGLSGRGDFLHRSIQESLRTDLSSLRPDDFVRTEGKIELANGTSRFGDVIVRDPVTGQIKEVHQIGNMRYQGEFRPSSRERGAIMDIRTSQELTNDARIIFHDKQGLVTLIDPDKQPDWKTPSNKHRKYLGGCK